MIEMREKCDQKKTGRDNEMLQMIRKMLGYAFDVLRLSARCVRPLKNADAFPQAATIDSVVLEIETEVGLRCTVECDG